MNTQETNTANKDVALTTEQNSFVARQYIEVPGSTTQQQPTDALSQLAANIDTLEALHSQLSFMVREIGSLNIKK